MSIDRNRNLAREMCAASVALAALPLAKLPTIGSISFGTYGPGMHLYPSGREAPADRAADIHAWAAALPSGTVHARPHDAGRWYLAARGELGTVPVEVWDLIPVDEQLAADLAAAGDEQAAGALLLARLGVTA